MIGWTVRKFFTYLIIETIKLQSGLVMTVMALPKNSSEQDNSSKLWLLPMIQNITNEMVADAKVTWASKLRIW